MIKLYEDNAGGLHLYCDEHDITAHHVIGDSFAADAQIFDCWIKDADPTAKGDVCRAVAIADPANGPRLIATYDAGDVSILPMLAGAVGRAYLGLS